MEVPAVPLEPVLQVLPSKVTPSKVTPAKVAPAKVAPAKVAPAEVVPAKVTPAKATLPSKVTPAKVTPAKVAPLELVKRVFGLVPDPVDELQIGALSVTVKATNQCPTCKKTYKKAGVWYQHHLENCGNPDYDDTFSENEGDNELA